MFQVPPESIERASGLLFFDKMSRSNLVEINGLKTTYVWTYFLNKQEHCFTMGIILSGMRIILVSYCC